MINKPAHVAHYIVLDQGTSATKSFIFDTTGSILHSERIKHSLNRPQPHHAESDPMEIVESCYRLIYSASRFCVKNNLPVHSIGVAVQRSTFLFWEKEGLNPLTPAISWQDNRAADVENELQTHKCLVHNKTGQPLSAHFGGPKFLHFIRKDSTLKSAVESGRVWFGPLSTFLIHSLTGQESVDESIACRSLLMDLDSCAWDSELCGLFEVPQNCLPAICPTIYEFGIVQIDEKEIPLTCVIGDQQAALLGQGEWQEGTIAMNFGTSGSLQLNTGNKPVHNEGLLSSVLWSTEKVKSYLLEGTVNACNSLFYWLETELKIPHREMFWHDRCEATETQGTFFPGLWGLAAPHWVSGKTNKTIGIPENADPNLIIRAAMESVGFLIHDIYKVIDKQLNLKPRRIVASGGGARSPLLQFLADLLEIPIGHTPMKDRTALGTYYLMRKAGDPNFRTQAPDCDRIFKPAMLPETRQKKLDAWADTLRSEGISPV